MPGGRATGGATRAPNWKRRLVALFKQHRTLRRRLARYKPRWPGRYKSKRAFMVARREEKRAWKRIRNIHVELANQVATRIVSACVHHGVELLRFEDLSWATHSAKAVAGGWLASWQVH